MDPIVVTGAASAVTGGFIAAGVQLYTARRKVPAERDSIIVTGAETAVLALERTLTAETKRADRAEAQVAERDAALARKDQRIEALEHRLDALQQALDAARDELHAIISGDRDRT